MEWIEFIIAVNEESEEGMDETKKLNEFVECIPWAHLHSAINNKLILIKNAVNADAIHGMTN